MITSSFAKVIDRIVTGLGFQSEQPCRSLPHSEIFERLEAEIDLYLRKINAKYYKNGLDEFFWD